MSEHADNNPHDGEHADNNPHDRYNWKTAEKDIATYRDPKPVVVQIPVDRLTLDLYVHSRTILKNAWDNNIPAEQIPAFAQHMNTVLLFEETLGDRICENYQNLIAKERDEADAEIKQKIGLLGPVKAETPVMDQIAKDVSDALDMSGLTQAAPSFVVDRKTDDGTEDPGDEPIPA